MPESDPRNIFEVTLPPLLNQTIRFTFHPVCPGAIVSTSKSNISIDANQHRRQWISLCHPLGPS